MPWGFTILGFNICEHLVGRRPSGETEVDTFLSRQDATCQLHQCHCSTKLQTVGVLWISAAGIRQGGPFALTNSVGYGICVYSINVFNSPVNAYFQVMQECHRNITGNGIIGSDEILQC